MRQWFSAAASCRVFAWGAMLVAVSAYIALTACANRYLPAGEKLASTLDEGTKTVSATIDERAKIVRIHRLMATQIPNPTGTPLPKEFIVMACQQYDSSTAPEHIALTNIKAYKATISAYATAPKDKDLVSLLRSIDATGKVESALKDPPAATEKLASELDKKFDTCADYVRATFEQTAGAPAALAVLAAWPKVKELFTVLAQSAEKNAREKALIALLKDEPTQAIILKSFDTLSTSAATGRVDAFLTQKKQLALWEAYYYYKKFQEPPTPKDNFSTRLKDAKSLADSLYVFDNLMDVNVQDVVKKMKLANDSLKKAVESGQLDNESETVSALAGLIEALDFLAAVNDKYTAAADAYDKAKAD